MKKLVAITAMLVMALALAACASAGSSATSSAESADNASSATAATSAEGSTSQAVGMPNPWTDVQTAAEAAEGAGVGSLTLPENGWEIDGGRVDLVEYRYMDLLAEADGYVGAAEMTVRKGVKNPDRDPGYDTADVSGDYTAYQYNWELDAAGWKVKCSGNEEGKAMRAIWLSDNFSYSISVRGQGDIHDTYGLSNDDIAALVGAIE